MNKEKQIEGLEEYIVKDISIECTRCNNGTLLEDYDSEEDAYDQGWRVTKNNCYCPDCVKKYLKPKVKKKK